MAETLPLFRQDNLAGLKKIGELSPGLRGPIAEYAKFDAGRAAVLMHLLSITELMKKSKDPIAEFAESGLAAAVELRKMFPRTPDVQRFVHLFATVHRDKAAALTAILAPTEVSVLDAPDVHLSRALVTVPLLLSTGKLEGLPKVLHELESLPPNEDDEFEGKREVTMGDIEVALGMTGAQDHLQNAIGHYQNAANLLKAQKARILNNAGYAALTLGAKDKARELFRQSAEVGVEDGWIGAVNEVLAFYAPDEKLNALRSAHDQLLKAYGPTKLRLIDGWLANAEPDKKAAAKYARNVIDSIDSPTGRLGVRDGKQIAFECPGKLELGVGISSRVRGYALEAGSYCGVWFVPARPLNEAQLRKLANAGANR